MKHVNFNFERKFKRFLATFLLAVLAVTAVPVSTVMAAESTDTTVVPAEVTSSYIQLSDDQVMPLVTTSYFIPDQEFSFVGTFAASPFYVPAACQARLVIAPIGGEPLYIRVFNGKNVCERTLTATPNEAQVLVFNISAGDHYLEFDSVTGSQFTIRLQMYTWDY